MNVQANQKFVDQIWESSILPTLQEYIRIPNKSVLFDPNWKANGHMDKAVKLLVDWCKEQAVEGMKLEVLEVEGRTPVIFMEIPGSSDETILLYGHLDKQPEMTGWDSDLGPWKPVLKGEKLFGRGGADDGYSTFASLTAIKSLQTQKIPHARCIILIEACEESGSKDLPFYIEVLKDRIGNPDLVVCLDSGCGNYDQLWMTNSLRGVLAGVLSIDVLKQGVHSGMGSGIVPSCFMVLRQLLDRIEDKNTGKMLLEDLFVEIPEQRIQQAKNSAEKLKEDIYSLTFCDGVKPISDDLIELILNRTWRPALSITGIDGLPANENAGNVTLPFLKMKLSVRIPPMVDAKKALQQLKIILEKNPPFGAKVHFEPMIGNPGWNAPIESDWLTEAANDASQNYFGKDAMYMGEGGTIPFMNMLGEKFPKAQFVITGLLGPESNAHGPNEFLHIPTAKRLTSCIAEIIAKHFTRNDWSV